MVLGFLAAGAAVALVLAALLWGRRTQTSPADTGGPSPYDEEFDRKGVNAVLDWYILRHIEDQVRQPVEQKFLDADRTNNDYLNRYFCHLLAKEGVTVAPIPSTLESSRRHSPVAEYTPNYFPDKTRDENVVTFKHERIARRLVRTVEYLQRIKEQAAEPLESVEKLKSGFWPFVPDGYAAFYNNLIASGQDFDADPSVREQMRKLAAHLIFPRFKEHVDFWANTGVSIYQVPEVIARDALQGWFGLEVGSRPMPTPTFMLGAQK